MVCHRAFGVGLFAAGVILTLMILPTIVAIARDVIMAVPDGQREAMLALEKMGRDRVSIVMPSITILAEPPVAVVDAVVDRRGTRREAQAYLDFLYTPEGQELAARHYYRPRNPEVLARHRARFPDVRLLTIDRDFGGWATAQKTHFDDGGTFDRIVEGRK